MFSKTAGHYDRIYGAFKNYSEESTKIATLIKEIHPRAQTVLDVACGTGEHARQLTERFGYVVDGIDLDVNLIALAALKNRGGKFSVADMIDFSLDKKFDVISCLFSSIGYVKTIENVERTLTQFKQHLAKDGVVIVEPWYAPDSWTEGKVFLKTYEDNDLKVARVSHAKRDGDLSVLDFEYLIGTVSGISHQVERHELGLFSIDTMKACFAHAGFTVVYDPVGLTDRGLYVGRLRQ